MSNIKKKRKAHEHAQSFTSGQVAAGVTTNYANATDSMIEGMDVFRQVVQATGDSHGKHGNLFECIEAAKFNVDAAFKWSDFNAQVTAHPADPTFPQDPHNPADVVIRDGSQTLREVQAKAYQEASSAASELKDEKYAGMGRLVPRDKEQRIRELTENRAESGSIYADDYRDSADHLTPELSKGDVSSGGTTYNEAVFSREHPGLYSSYMEFSQLTKEVGASARAAGITGFAIGGTISAVKNVMAVRQGQKKVTEAAIDSCKEGFTVGAKSSVIGGAGAILRFGGRKAGFETLAKTNVATALAAGIINTGVTVNAYAKGEIDASTAMERMGQTSVSTVYALFAGSAIGVVFSGPAAAMTATIAGYLLANAAYQSCIAISKDAKLTEENAKKIRQVLEEATEQMRTQREEFERQVEERLKSNQVAISESFKAIDISLKKNRTDETLIALSDFAQMFGKQLRFKNFKDFDDFMQSSERLLF